MNIKDVILQEFLKRIDLETICQSEDILANALEEVLGGIVDARELVKELKKAYFDQLYEKFAKKIKRTELQLHEVPEKTVKIEEVREETSDVRYEVLMGIVFVESAIKRAASIEILEKVLSKLGVPTENLSEILEELKRENLIEETEGSVTVTREGKVKVQELKPSETFRKWKDIVSRDEDLKQLLFEQRKKVTTLGDLGK